MKRIYNVLIIDAHQITIDTIKNALSFVQNKLEDVEFIYDQAKNCESAYKKIKNASKLKSIDLFFLDISLPPSLIDKIFSGQDLGTIIKKKFSDSKIIVCTNFNNNSRLNSIIKTINPDSLLVKCDIDFQDIVQAIKMVLDCQTYYSKTVISLLRKKVSSSIVLEAYDIQILYEISNGARMKELLQLIPLSKAGIEKRKRKLKIAFNLKEDNDRALILAAREKGFI